MDHNPYAPPQTTEPNAEAAVRRRRPYGIYAVVALISLPAVLFGIGVSVAAASSGQPFPPHIGPVRGVMMGSVLLLGFIAGIGMCGAWRWTWCLGQLYLLFFVYGGSYRTILAGELPPASALVFFSLQAVASIYLCLPAPRAYFQLGSRTTAVLLLLVAACAAAMHHWIGWLTAMPS